jgi:hypothetical protein
LSKKPRTSVFCVIFVCLPVGTEMSGPGPW